MTGAIINTAAIVAGGLCGHLFGKLLKDRHQETLTMACGVGTLFLSIAGAMNYMLHYDLLPGGGSMLIIACLALGGLIGEILSRGFFREGAQDQGLCDLITGLRIEMHQCVDDDFFHVFLLRVDDVQHEDGFSVVAVDLEIPGLGPGRIVDQLQFYIPSRDNSEFFAVFLKQGGYLFSVHYAFLTIDLICIGIIPYRRFHGYHVCNL